MAYRVLALTIAAAVSLASATLAKEHCPVGQVYFRSKHTCVGKRTAIARKIYHYPRHVAAKADEAAIVHHRLRRARAATSAPSIPLPPVRLVGTGTLSAPAQNEADEAAIVHHRLRRARAATSAPSIPLPPVRLVGTGTAAQNETVGSSGSVLPPTPG